MSEKTRPPFRADHVGSLLRPQRLKEARERREAGKIGSDELRAIEDDCIREVVKLQEDAGLKGVTDGEFRRTNWSSDFLTAIEGVEFGRSKVRASFHRADGTDLQRNVTSLAVTRKLARPDGIQTRDFEFLNSVTNRVPKVSIPSPSMLHFRGGREAIDSAAYPDMEDFFADLTAIYKAEVMDLAALGARYIQFDDTNFAYLCDPKLRAQSLEAGHDPDDLPRLYCRLINDIIRDRPADMAACVHMCRGNFKSAWIAEGGYEPVAEVLFTELEADGIFMEYDDERSGDFAPLRFLPPGKIVVLGLVTTKRAALESKDDLKRRIEEAASFAPIEQLALSPQCGFSSTVEGNELTVEDEIAKLRLVVETAQEVWPDA
ncbi:MAG TPA: 5-methyltetrahydropteroyltriglutamate--homocysteine S-methyltransferase [Alphaproteobacteria bacterium]|nr:5-methyltetrahydropteroyltriglutamate--homocysteine S-methyltransferase [Alphaproteobacteria bacterium]